jgi:hypothetical protein
MDMDNSQGNGRKNEMEDGEERRGKVSAKMG